MSSPPSREVILFSAALELPPDQRAAYLDGACADDCALRQHLENLLRVHEEATHFLETAPPVAPQSPREHGDEGAAIHLNAAPPEKAGDRIGHYKLLQQIGEGGCGVVYMAEQEEPVRRRVALKVIKLGMDTRQVVARFEAERQALALMDHPNIAKVFDAGATDTGRPYFVMELVRGIKATDYCDQNEVSTEGRLKLFIQVCQAIQHAHQKGIIHRDIKPSNILVADHDGAPVPKIIDFGIAKATSDQPLTDRTVFTAFEQFVGTPAYMSPEQAQLSGLDIDTRTDIYSLGVLLYELLTGQTPFDAKALMAAGLDEMRRIIREQQPARPSTRLSTMRAADLTAVARRRHCPPPKLFGLIRGDLDWIVMKALEKDRTRRYPTANGLGMDVQRHLSCEPVIARPPSRLYEFQKTVRRHKVGFAATVALITVLTAGIAVSAWEAFRATRAERAQSQLLRQAEAERQKAQIEASKSQEVARFLKDMLDSVEPSVALGRDTTLLREILDKTAERVGHDLTNQPEVELTLRSTLANAYHELGLYARSEEMARRGLQLARGRPGEENADLAVMLDSLGDALWHLDRLDEAEKCGREALALQRPLVDNERLTKDQRAAAAVSLNLLGEIQRTRGQPAEAERTHREALALRRRLLGNEHPAVANSLHNLAGPLGDQHKMAEAEAAVREALAIRRKLSGEEHPEVVTSLNTLGAVLHARGKLSEAEDIFRRTLALRVKLDNQEHPEVATSLNNLGKVLADEGKLGEAETLFRRAVDMRKKLLGNEHPRVAWSLNELATVLHLEGKFDEAESAAREALAIRTKRLAGDHPELADSLNTLGSVLAAQSKWAEAEKRLRQALAIRRARFDKASPEVGFTLDSLGQLLAAEGRLPEAEATFREALSTVGTATVRPASQESPVTPMLMHHFAALRRLQKALPEARQWAAEAVAIYRHHPGWPDYERQHALDVLESVLVDLGDMAALEAMFRTELGCLREVSTNAPSAETPRLGVTLYRLAALLWQRNALTEACPLAEESVALYQRHPDWPSTDRQYAVDGLGFVLVDLGELAGAEELYRGELAHLRSLSTNNPAREIPPLGVTMHHLADVLRKRKALVEARSLAEEAAALYRHHPDWPAHEQQHALEVLADVMTDLGDRVGAEAVYREQLHHLRKQAPDDAKVASVMAQLTMNLLEQKKFAQAEVFARECLAIREKKLPDHWLTFNGRSMLGGALLGQKNYAEAETWLLSGYEGLEQRKDKIPPVARIRLKEALERLVQFYQATDRPGQEAKWKTKLAEFAKTEK